MNNIVCSIRLQISTLFSTLFKIFFKYSGLIKNFKNPCLTISLQNLVIIKKIINTKIEKFSVISNYYYTMLSSTIFLKSMINEDFQQYR